MQALEPCTPSPTATMAAARPLLSLPGLSCGGLGCRPCRACLQAVERFVVGHEEFGEVQFLVPVDLRGLDLDKLILMAKGRIQVFSPPTQGTEHIGAHEETAGLEPFYPWHLCRASHSLALSMGPRLD